MKKDRIAESIKNIDFSGIKIPQFVVYNHPKDYPVDVVARIFDAGNPTDTVILRTTEEEITEEILKNALPGEFTRFEPGAEDDPVILCVWM